MFPGSAETTEAAETESEGLAACAVFVYDYSATWRLCQFCVFLFGYREGFEFFERMVEASCGGGRTRRRVEGRA